LSRGRGNQRRRINIYFDRCFGIRFPEAVWKAKPPFNVEHHHSPKTRFRHNIPDDEWLSDIGARGWFAFSHDRKFHHEIAACAAIKQHNIGCFYLWGANAGTWDKLRCFVRAYDRIVAVAKTTPKPFIFNVAHNGRLTQVPIP
jgi:hypothetical protein